MTPVSHEGRDDVALPFAVEALDIRGRIVRLGDTINHILDHHAYPPLASRVLGEAMTLTVLLGSSLKDVSRFQLQTKTSGPLGLIVVDFDAPGHLRAYIQIDHEKLSAFEKEHKTTTGDLLGHGHLAMTIEQNRGSQDAAIPRYQGIIALEGQGFEEAAHQYFRQSEQIPTRIRLAVAETYEQDKDANITHHFRAGGIMVQFLPSSPERQRQADLDPGEAPEGTQKPEFIEDEAWVESRALIETVEDHELVDPMIGSERLLYRLFHERGVKIFPVQTVEQRCRCSDERIRSVVSSFPPEDRQDMIGEDGKITITCEFCSTTYTLDPAEIT